MITIQKEHYYLKYPTAQSIIQCRQLALASNWRTRKCVVRSAIRAIGRPTEVAEQIIFCSWRDIIITYPLTSCKGPVFAKMVYLVQIAPSWICMQ